MTDPNAFIASRVEELLARMTVEEKAQQLCAVVPVSMIGRDRLIESELERTLQLGIGQIGFLGTLGFRTPEENARVANQLQRYLVERTRLGIPAVFHSEALNGVVAPGFPVFPTAIGLAATWNPAAVEEMTTIIRRQLRSIGQTQALSPVMDVARDARWGRVHETYGEDPYLVSAFSVAFTRGLQGQDLSEGVIATAKHFLGFAQTEGGQNMAASVTNGRELYEVFARPFEAAIKLAGLASVMNSYSTVDGVPVAASREVLTSLLRERMGFRGSVISDYDSVAQLASRQHVARDAVEAARLALTAGIDIEAPTPFGYGPVLAAAVEKGEIPSELLDRAVRRVLSDKFALGLFEQPYASEDRIEIQQIASEGIELANTLAQQSITLLKNDGGLLPLSPDIRRIAVVGPHADGVDFAFPPYTYPGALGLMRAQFAGSQTSMAGMDDAAVNIPRESTEALIAGLSGPLALSPDDFGRQFYGAQSLTEAIRERLPNTEVVSSPGCGVTPSEPSDIAAAVEAARSADVVILALGGRPGWLGGGMTEGEGSDTANIDLPSQQVELVHAIVASGIPAVGVVYTGRPFALTAIADALPALIYGYYGGQHAGPAMAGVLFGDVNPGGKLPLTLPRHSGQVPIHSGQRHGSGYRRTATDVYKGYLDMPSTPLFAFGHGRSYTTFDYSQLGISSDQVDIGGAVTISCIVTNKGERSGDEIVQIYLADQATGVTRPAQELVGFARVPLEPGASAGIDIEVQMSQLGYVGAGGDFILEPGPITVLVGGASDDIRLTGSFDVVGETMQLMGKRSYLSEARVREL